MTTEIVDELTQARAFQLQLANHIYLCYEILARLAERRKPKGQTMTDFSKLADDIERYAKITNTGMSQELMFQAAEAIRILMNDIVKHVRIKEILYKEHQDFMADCKRCNDSLKEAFKQ